MEYDKHTTYPLPLPPCELRATLARANITVKKFSEECGLSYTQASRVLHSDTSGMVVGELSRIKVTRGLRKLGLLPSDCKGHA